jgi:1,4-alpha-glucan branching enzyme
MEMRLKGLSCLCRAGIVTILLMSAFWSCVNSPILKPGIPQSMAGVVRFTVLAPGAKKVFLVGSFNGWAKDATPMAVVNGASLWAVDVPLKEGEHTFMYLIDGIRWVTPTLAEDFVTDEFGHTNGVVIVR